jgi:hypothetical protein
LEEDQLKRLREKEELRQQREGTTSRQEAKNDADA